MARKDESLPFCLPLLRTSSFCSGRLMDQIALNGKFNFVYGLYQRNSSSVTMGVDGENVQAGYRKYGSVRQGSGSSGWLKTLFVMRRPPGAMKYLSSHVR
jgi:hypothetical protein